MLVFLQKTGEFGTAGAAGLSHVEMQRVPKRLYVGGLGHAVSKAELQERFGKFGHVLDTEIITRQDDQGNSFVSIFKSTWNRSF